MCLSHSGIFKEKQVNERTAAGNRAQDTTQIQIHEVPMFILSY